MRAPTLSLFLALLVTCVVAFSGGSPVVVVQSDIGDAVIPDDGDDIVLWTTAAADAPPDRTPGAAHIEMLQETVQSIPLAETPLASVGGGGGEGR